MKFSKSSLLVLSLISLLAISSSKVLIKSGKAKVKSAASTTNKAKNKIVTIAEAYNIPGMPASIAISSADVHFPNATDEYDDYKNPMMVKHLMEEVGRPGLGPLEAIGEVPTIHDYYDGSMNLNKVKIECKLYTSKQDCINSSYCGWCGANGGCVLGNAAGPTQPCIKASMIYGNPVPNFNPIVRKINENVGGVTQHIISGISR